MLVRLLGPIDIAAPDGLRPVRGLRRKAVLSVLALHPGEIVSTDRLIDLAWGDEADSVARNTVQSHVSYLRGILGGRDAIIAQPPGYRLGADVDATMADTLIARASGHVDPAQRVRETRAALDLWRGRPLDDITGLRWLDEQADRLERLRQRAIRTLAAARLALGEHADLLPELEAMARAHPFDEELHGHLILALYRSGRPADALDAYRRLRRVLADEMGIDPAPSLRDLELAILREDPAAGFVPGFVPSPAAGVVPTSAASMVAGFAPTSAAGVAVGVVPTSAADSAAGVAPTSAAGMAVGVVPTSAAGVAVGVVPTSAAGVAAGFAPTSAAGMAAGVAATSAAGMAAGVVPGLTAGFTAGPAAGVMANSTARSTAARVAVATDAGLPRPAQLPATVAGFTGREAELAALDACATGTAVVSGTAGVGKTVLAVHWAHRAARRFPDGQLYVDLRGFDPHGAAVDSGAALRGLLRALGVDDRDVPADLDAQAALYRDRLAGRRVLVLLDNARDAAQVRPLLPASAGSLAVVTSRDRLAGLVATEGATPVTLDLLTPAGSRALLVRRLGDRATAEPDAIDDIADRCAGLPLALAVAAARAATQPRLPLATIAADLRETPLDGMDDGDPRTDVRAVLSWSYRVLAEPEARLFRLLGLHPGPDVSVAVAASLTGDGPADVRRRLDRLTRAHLAARGAADRYQQHDLLRAYAAEVLAPAEHGPATRRLVHHYLRTAYDAVVLVYPTAERFPLAEPPADIRPESMPDRTVASGWFAAERPALVGTVLLAVAASLDAEAVQLATAIAPVLRQHGHWHDVVTVATAAAPAAARCGDDPGQARARRLLGVGYAQLGRTADAARETAAARALYVARGDHAGIGRCDLNSAIAADNDGRYADALAATRRALSRYERTDDRIGRADGHSMIGWCLFRLGDPATALVELTTALHLIETDPPSPTFAGTWDSIGCIHRAAGALDEAVDALRRSIAAWRSIGDRLGEAQAEMELARAYEDAGDAAAAGAAWRAALDALDEIGHAQAASVRARIAAIR